MKCLAEGTVHAPPSAPAYPAKCIGSCLDNVHVLWGDFTTHFSNSDFCRPSVYSNYTITDCRSFVLHLVCKNQPLSIWYHCASVCQGRLACSCQCVKTIAKMHDHVHVVHTPTWLGPWIEHVVKCRSGMCTLKPLWHLTLHHLLLSSREIKVRMGSAVLHNIRWCEVAQCFDNWEPNTEGLL